MNSTAWVKLRNIEKELNGMFFERQEVIRGLLVGLIAKSHVVLLGPKGEGKTDITSELCSRIGGNYFHWLTGRTTVAEELFGPVSVKKYLENESYEYVTRGKLPEANVAFLDEIFKANSTVLNLNLGIMENRIFFNGSSPQEVPLHMLVGASNELPEEGEGLEAFWDRFALRYVVKPIQAKKNFLSVLDKVDNALMNNNESVRTTITLDELEEMQAEARKIVFGDVGKELLVKVWEALRELGYVISTRKYVQAVSLLKASAFIEGRMEVEESDLTILAHSFWDDEEQRLKIAQTLIRMGNPLELEAEGLLDAATEVHASFKNSDEDYKVKAAQEANAKLVKMKNRLDDILAEAKKDGKPTVKIEDIHAKVKVMNEEAVALLLGW